MLFFSGQWPVTAIRVLLEWLLPPQPPTPTIPPPLQPPSTNPPPITPTWPTGPRTTTPIFTPLGLLRRPQPCRPRPWFTPNTPSSTPTTNITTTFTTTHITNTSSNTTIRTNTRAIRLILRTRRPIHKQVSFVTSGCQYHAGNRFFCNCLDMNLIFLQSSLGKFSATLTLMPHFSNFRIHLTLLPHFRYLFCHILITFTATFLKL